MEMQKTAKLGRPKNLQKRQDILEAAAELFPAKGFAGVSMMLGSTAAPESLNGTSNPFATYSVMLKCRKSGITLRTIASPLTRSQERVFILCGIADEPTWPSWNPSLTNSCPAISRIVVASDDGAAAT